MKQQDRTLDMYADILHAKRPISRRRPMSVHDRAAQFAPFAALTGHKEDIAESSRYVDKKYDLSDDEKELLDRIIQEAQSKIEDKPMLLVTYFRPDGVKEGGIYQQLQARLCHIDAYRRELCFEGNIRIAISLLKNIEILHL